MAATPLPIDLEDINTYLACKPLQIDRDEFEAAIFALDDADRAEWERKQAKQVNPPSGGFMRFTSHY
ncbi:hypothetical protein [Mixta mediterraneensis]|uniref:hypothetical protein n=1 Tax=Mixta mediterraneensis TaxID=2758443 RepID=UPI001874B268|nr:hypothetical protein [Mixta mediterraneensis]MBE5254510.1 hypothetical protein [Mixta mediterraneensis]